jgi:hypothetical protein
MTKPKPPFEQHALHGGSSLSQDSPAAGTSKTRPEIIRKDGLTKVRTTPDSPFLVNYSIGALEVTFKKSKNSGP